MYSVRTYDIPYCVVRVVMAARRASIPQNKLSVTGSPVGSNQTQPHFTTYLRAYLQYVPTYLHHVLEYHHPKQRDCGNERAVA